MRNKLVCACLALLMLVVFSLTAAAQEFDADQSGSISVSLVSKTGDTVMAGAELSVFYVASVECSADGKLLYAYTAEFAGCGIPLDAVDLAAGLDAFVAEHPVSCRKIVTDSRGSAVCEDLPLGLYFIRQTGVEEGFALCTPFLVTVPFETGEGFVYHVDASPKADVARPTDVTIRKVWNVDESEDVPDSVTVRLLRGEMLVATSVLNAMNDWQVIHRNLPQSDAYRIVEVNVPQGFTATYAREGNIFTVTNTSSLAQTGQLVWPIPVFAMAGIVFLMLGFVILRKSGKQNG